MQNSCDVTVIGSGPAGLVAAREAALGGKRVFILEKNKEAGKKIYATGNGRCNFMNMNMENADELFSYCREIGLAPVIEEGGRVYPRSRQASAAAKILIYGAKNAGAEFFGDTAVTDVRKTEQGFMVKSDKGDFSCRSLVIASGGKAGIQYGCTGDGYRWAKAFGHTVNKPIPALTGLECAEDISLLYGVRIPARVSLICRDADRIKEIASDEGEVQFSKNGISGICVMNLSRYFRTGEGLSYSLGLDLYPEYTQEELIDLFMHQIKAAGCAMEGLVPEKMHDYLHTRIKPGRHNPETMAALSRKLLFTVTGSRGWKDAQVTSGGVLTDEVDKGFQSKLVKGLYFAGEILDYDGPCGGYNIGFAIRSGRTAGRASAL